MEHHTTKRKARNAAFAVAAGLSALAVCIWGVSVGGTEAAFNSSATQSATVTTKPAVDLRMDTVKTVDDTAALTGMNGGETRSVMHTLINSEQTSGHVKATVHMSGPLAHYATLNLKIPSANPENGQWALVATNVTDGQVIDIPTSTGAMDWDGGDGATVSATIAIADDNAAVSLSMSFSIDYLLSED